jgi:hypothetical protein
MGHAPTARSNGDGDGDEDFMGPGVPPERRHIVAGGQTNHITTNTHDCSSLIHLGFVCLYFSEFISKFNRRYSFNNR